MIITASQLRINIYQILDRIKKMGKINGDPESLVHMDWTHEWKGRKEKYDCNSLKIKS